MFADPLTGVAHLANRGGPLLLTSPGALDSRVSAYLLSVRPSLGTLYIYGGTAAISMVIESDLDTLLNG